MEVIKVSNTIQKFNGESYYLAGIYFQRKGKRLHRAVWEYHNGEIPTGYHIHHKDGNKHNNNIENLEMVLAKEHNSYHMSQPENVNRSKEAIKIAQKAACEWHKSEKAFDFHSRLAKQNWDKRTMQTYNCSFCGKEFQTMHMYGAHQNHFCHPNCKAKYGRMKRKNESQERY